MTSDRKQGASSPSNLSAAGAGNRGISETGSSFTAFNFANALATFSSAQWLEKILHFLRETHAVGISDDHSTEPLFEAEIVSKITPSMISEHLVDDDANCGIAKLLAAVIDIERPSLTRKVTHRILENSAQNPRIGNAVREITLLYASAALLCCNNANVEVELLHDQHLAKYPAHVALTSRNLGFFEFAEKFMMQVKQAHKPQGWDLARTLLVADDMGDLARAIKFANEVQEPAVWRAVGSRLAAALESDNLSPSGPELASALYSAVPASRIPGSYSLSFARG